MYKRVSSIFIYFSDYLVRFINEVEFKIVVNKLNKKDLLADVDDQRFHHFLS